MQKKNNKNLYKLSNRLIVITQELPTEFRFVFVI